MKKSVKILIGVLCLIIVGLVTFIVVDKFKNSKHEENNTVIAEDNNNNLTNATNNIRQENQINIEQGDKATSNKIKGISKDDFIIKGVSLGMTYDEVIEILGLPDESFAAEDVPNYTVLTYKEDTTNEISIALNSNNDNKEQSVESITIGGNSNICIRNVGIGSTKDDILKAFPEESILSNKQSVEFQDNTLKEIIVIGNSNDDLRYATSIDGNGRIYFGIDSTTNKVSYFSVTI